MIFIKLKNKIEYLINKICKSERRNKILMILLITATIGILKSIDIIKVKGAKVSINGYNMSKLFKNEKIVIYIGGEINNPGYIEVPAESNLEFAINKAGGITQNADIENIDEQSKLKSGEKIIIPSKSKVSANTSNEIIDSDKININTADEIELQELEGIGEKTAKRIVEYRQKQRFKNIEDLINVNGIGTEKYNKIKDLITIY